MNITQQTISSFDLGKPHIHKINLHSVMISSNLEKIVKKIIIAYNLAKGDNQDAYYKPVPLPNEFAIEGYSLIKVYYAKPQQPLNKIAKLLMKIGSVVDFSTNALDLLFFLGSEHNDLFALTTNHGWKVIKKYSDCEFPIKMVKILTEANFTYAEVKPIVGNIISHSEAYKDFQAQEYQLQNIWKIFKTFETSLKANSSMYQLSAFSKLSGEKIGVSVGVGQLSFGLNLTLPHLCETLDHLAKIYRGEGTLNLGGEPETEDPKYRFLDYIQSVKNGFHKTLNEYLEDKVWKLFSNQIKSIDFFFCHRYSIDFCRSKEFRLEYRDNEETIQLKTWHSAPSFSDVISLLRTAFKEIHTKNEFIKTLKNLYLKYEKNESYYNLKEFFQGEIRSQDGAYFRVEGVWYEVKADYLIIVQRHFYHLVQNHLFKGHLDKSWFRKPEWTSFSIEEAAASSELSADAVDRHLKVLAKSTFMIVDDKGKVKHPHALSTLFGKGIEKRQADLDYLLKTNHTITTEDLKKAGFEKPEEILKKLQKPRPIVTSFTKNKIEQWIASGAVPATSLIKDFLTRKHQQFLQVGEEEFYNRSYLETPGFLVGDQLYPSDIEKVELWDLLYHGEPETLYLYQVKGGFNQHTRDACSQIRVAAQNLRADLSSKDYPRLTRLYNKATQGEKNSVFRKKIADAYKKLTLTQFIELFRSKATQKTGIVFVYAMLDDGDGTERLLSEEQDIELPFAINDFSKWSNGLIDILKTSGYLNDELQITPKVLRCSAKEFCKDQTIPLTPDQRAELYQLLNQRDTHFNSIIAKLELINLKFEVEKAGFGLKIVQISRGQTTLPPLVATSQATTPPNRILLQSNILSFFSPTNNKRSNDGTVPDGNKRVKRTEIPGCPGISNTGTDCFLISALQMLLHSNIRTLLTNKSQFSQEDNDWFEKFSTFQQSFEDTDRTVPLTVNQLRASLDFPPATQEDASEAISKILSYYDTSTHASAIRFVREIKKDHAHSLNRINNSYSQLNQDNCVETEGELIVLPLELQKETFQSLLNRFFSKKEVIGSFTFANQDEELYRTDRYQEECIPLIMNETLIVSLKRFNKQGKLHTHVDFEDGKCQIGHTKYQLHSFIVHQGESKNSGHYLTYCKERGEGWLCYNDDTVTPISEDDALKEAKLAYIVLLQGM